MRWSKNKHGPVRALRSGDERKSDYEPLEYRIARRKGGIQMGFNTALYLKNYENFVSFFTERSPASEQALFRHIKNMCRTLNLCQQCVEVQMVV